MGTAIIVNTLGIIKKFKYGESMTNSAKDNETGAQTIQGTKNIILRKMTIFQGTWRGGCSTGLDLCNFFLCDFALMRLQNSYHFSNLCDNFWFNMIWHRQSVAALIFCRRLAESEVIVMPSLMCI